jgi:predicted RNase H-like HicB family nuclease
MRLKLAVLQLLPSPRLLFWHAQQHSKASRAEGDEMMRYAFIIEKAGKDFSAYVPDLPGCVATGTTVQSVVREIRDAIRLHIEGLEADGSEAPQPTTIAE